MILTYLKINNYVIHKYVIYVQNQINKLKIPRIDTASFTCETKLYEKKNKKIKLFIFKFLGS